MPAIVRGRQGHLELNHIVKAGQTDFSLLPTSEGLSIERVISREDGNYNLVVAFVYYNAKEKDCYLETVSDRLQTYAAEYEEWQDFIMLVDEAYRLVKLNNGVEDYE